MQITLEKSIVEQLSARGILAYVAVKMADGAVASTAALAQLVRCQTSAMLEGLKELSVVAPGAVEPADKRGSWRCGTIMAGAGELISPVVDSERYRAFVDDLKKYWDFLNPDTEEGGRIVKGIPFEMDGRDGAQIRRFLASNRAWTVEQWRKALHNRVLSIVNYGHASRSEAIWKWVTRLKDYAAGPLNQYNKPAEGSGKRGEAISIQQGNREAGAAFLDRVRKTNGNGH